MSELYLQKTFLQSIFPLIRLFIRRVTQKAICLLTIMLFVVQFASAQVSGSFNFETSMQGWTTVGYGEFVQTNTNACEVGNSTRANVYYNSTNNLISPLLGTANGTPITMSFDYKVLDYLTLEAAPGSQVDIKAQWSNSVSGPWTTASTVNVITYIPSTNCTTKTLTFVPLAGPLFMRLQNKAVGANTDIYYYFDNIIFSEGGAVGCPPPSSIVVDPATVSANGFTFSWTAPTFEPAQGYQYEIRTSGIAGSGPVGLAASGEKEQGVTMADIAELSPNTTYTIYLRSKCATSDFSSWSSSIPRTTLCLAENIPYIMPLNAAILPTAPNCVTIENVNIDDRFWKTVAPTAGIAGKVLHYNYNYAMPADDWFFTPLLNLTAGTSYRISFKYKISSYQEKLKIAIGSLPTANEMTTTLIDLTIPSTTTGAQQQFVDFTVPNNGEYSVGFQAHSNANSNLLYIGEVSVGFGPTCLAPTAVSAYNIDKISATINWTAATIYPENGYVYEVRTSGAAGSGVNGLATTGTVAAGITTIDLDNLEPETDYRIYVASKCSEEDQSTWTTAIRIKTLCDYLELQAGNDTICQGSTATLEASGVDSDVNWYESQDSSGIIFTGPLFTTPVLQATTSYFAQAKIIEENQVVKIGSGDQLAQNYQNPFYSVWSNNHTQHIILANEMRSQGMIEGPVNSVALVVTNAGTLPMIGLNIKVGKTTTTELSAFIENSSFVTIYTSPSYMPAVGTNVFQFSEPFMWDGTSNIVLEFCHGNPVSSPTMSRAVLADDTEYFSSIKANFFTATEPADVCANSTNNVTSYNIRPVFIFSGTILCQAPQRTEVVATVNQVQPIIASQTQILTVDAFEDATLADLEPAGLDILWFSTLEDALTITAELPVNTPLQSNSTYYAVRLDNDCYSSPFAVFVTVQLGTKTDNLESLLFYPNPVKEELTIESIQEISSIKVFNMIGQEVMSLSSHAATVVVDMSSLSTATYLLHINTDNGSKIIKVFKN